MNRLDGVAKALFGEKSDSLLAEALVRLVPDEAPDYANLLVGCCQSTDYRSVANIMVAVTVRYPSVAELLLAGVVDRFSQPSFPDPIGPATEGFVLGAVLGLFRAGVWLDNNHHTTTPFAREFERQFPTQFPKVIFSKRKMMRFAFSPQGGDNRHRDRSYEEDLSQAVKAWVWPQQGCLTARRMAQYGALVANLNRELKGRERSGEPLPLFVALVLDKIAFAEFSGLSAAGRIDAVDAFNERLRARLGG